MLLLHVLQKLHEVPGACFTEEVLVHITVVRLYVIKFTKLKTEIFSYAGTFQEFSDHSGCHYY